MSSRFAAAAGLALVLAACVQPRANPLTTGDARARPVDPDEPDAGEPTEERDAPADPADPDAGPTTDSAVAPVDVGAGCSVSGCPMIRNATSKCTSNRCEYTCDNPAYKKCADGCWPCCGLDSECPASVAPDRIARCISNRCEDACQAINCYDTPGRCLPQTGLCLAAFTPPGAAGCSQVQFQVCNYPNLPCEGVDHRSSLKIYGMGDSLEQLCGADHVKFAREICGSNSIIKELRAGGMEAGVVLTAHTFGTGGDSSAVISVGTYDCP
jgi:hypothetical protein